MTFGRLVGGGRGKLATPSRGCIIFLILGTKGEQQARG
jgi:hypothetical protein